MAASETYETLRRLPPGGLDELFGTEFKPLNLKPLGPEDAVQNWESHLMPGIRLASEIKRLFPLSEDIQRREKQYSAILLHHDNYEPLAEQSGYPLKTIFSVCRSSYGSCFKVILQKVDEDVTLKEGVSNMVKKSRLHKKQDRTDNRARIALVRNFQEQFGVQADCDKKGTNFDKLNNLSSNDEKAGLLQDEALVTAVVQIARQNWIPVKAFECTELALSKDDQAQKCVDELPETTRLLINKINGSEGEIAVLVQVYLPRGRNVFKNLILNRSEWAKNLRTAALEKRTITLLVRGNKDTLSSINVLNDIIV